MPRAPVAALHAAVRHSDEARTATVITHMLRTFPLHWTLEAASADSDFTLTSISVIRSQSSNDDDGFAFALHNGSHTVTAVLRADEVPQLAVGDRVVTVNGFMLSGPLREAVAAESVATLGVWKKSAMTKVRAKLARAPLEEALIAAAQYATEPAASRIVSRLLGARVAPGCRGAHGRTALHWAAARGELALCTLLIDARAAIDGTRHAAHTPLQLAVIGGHGAVVRTMLMAKADAQATCEGGRQLIHLAALGPCADIVELLLEPSEGGGKQNLDARSTHGWSPLFLAASADNLPMVRSSQPPLVNHLSTSVSHHP